MPYNNGRYMENKFVYMLDGVKIKDMDRDARSFLRNIYGQLDDEEIVRSELVQGFRKPDFYVEYKGNRQYISMKTNTSHTLHEEELESFVEFLKDIGLQNNVISMLQFLFWGDGSFNGTAKRIFSISEAYMKAPDMTRQFNEMINENNEIISKIVNRIIFDGGSTDGVKADYLLHYRENEIPIVVSQRQMANYILSKDWHFKDNPHIGPLQFSPKAIKPEAKHYEYYRKRIGFWWAHLREDLEYISQRYVNWERKKTDGLVR